MANYDIQYNLKRRKKIRHKESIFLWVRSQLTSLALLQASNLPFAPYLVFTHFFLTLALLNIEERTDPFS